MTYHRKFSSKCQKMDLKKNTSTNYQTSQALVLHLKKNHLEATPIYICSLFIGYDKQDNMLI